MADIKNLYETIGTEKQVIKKYKPEILEIPKYISENLKYGFFDWQKEAFENFLVYQEDHKKTPTHLMFNMATGTGKTLLMASTILYYYQQGYRHFLFFVNQNNIVDKTENNFIDNTHTKYLFKEKIVIDDKTITIKKVDTFKFKDIEKYIVQKAINIKAKQENSLFQFEKLKEELEIESIEELQTDKLADFDVKIIVSKNTNYDDIDNSDKLGLMIKFLDNIFAKLKDKIAPKIGSEFITGDFKKFFAEPKTKTIEVDSDSERIAKELETENWYVLDSFHGTSEEKELIGFIKETIGNLESNYKEIYLLRNEEVYKIFDFEQGRGFQPDFILFLKTKNKKKVGVVETELYYQILIESKGNRLTA